MKLNIESLNQKDFWERNGFALPQFNIQETAARTRQNPVWLHMGAGNIFRIFPSAAQQKLLNAGLSDTGIIVCEAFDEEIIDKSFTPFDNLCVGVTMKADGLEKEIIASVTECVKASAGRERLVEIFTNPALQMVSFTITEKGYAVRNANGFLPFVAADISAGPEKAAGLMGLTVALCFARFRANSAPLALVSMDNCSENGEKLKTAVMAIAEAWVENGAVPQTFIGYLQNAVAFPWSMIDKITPRPSEDVKNQLAALGLEGMDIVRTAKNTYVAPFVNAEETQYLIIEDTFPNGKPPLEQAGFIFTTRDTVQSVEAMKVGACLNPLHTALAVFGCLLGYTSISDEMRDEGLVNLITLIGYTEALPWVPDPGIISPKEFLDQVVNVRFPNPFIPDTPQRIATDTSQKIPVRYGESLKKMVAAGTDLSALRGFPFFFAGWLRYLMAVDDAGKPFEPSPDPMLAELQGYLKNIRLGCTDERAIEQAAAPILSNSAIFGVDLYACGLAEKVLYWFKIFVKAPGEVRKALRSI